MREKIKRFVQGLVGWDEDSLIKRKKKKESKQKERKRRWRQKKSSYYRGDDEILTEVVEWQLKMEEINKLVIYT